MDEKYFVYGSFDDRIARIGTIPFPAGSDFQDVDETVLVHGAFSPTSLGGFSVFISPHGVPEALYYCFNSRKQELFQTR